MRQLKAVGDVLELLKAEKAAREAKKQGKKRKRKRHHRQRMTELRMYARYLEEGRRERRESDRRRMALARREEHESELHLERERQAARLEKGRTRYERIVASFEEDMQKLEALRAYFDRLTFEPPEREQGQELELED
jgi:hypothetical protein